MSRRRAPKHAPVATGRVRGFAQGGDGLVDTEEGRVLVPGALDGELVKIDRIERRGRVARGRLSEVVEPSKMRTEPACALLSRCGGCPWMRLERDAQRAAIVDLVRSAIHRAPGADVAEIDVVSEGPSVGYRRRARLAFRAGKLGYRGRRSREIVDVDRCIVLRPELSLALERLRRDLLPLLIGEGEIRLAIGDLGRPVVMVESREAQGPDAYRVIEALVAEGTLSGAALAVGAGAVPAIWGDAREHAPGVDREPLVGTIGGFSQANELVNRRLVEWVRARALPSGMKILELYAGHGNLTVALADEANSIVTVELDKAASAACRQNLETRGLSARVLEGDAGASGSWQGKSFDVVVLDPPRAGARAAVPAILEAAPRRIVYVSCDTSTLGRDLAALGEGGYRVVEVSAFDMFPNTGHVETAVLLEPV